MLGTVPDRQGRPVEVRLRAGRTGFWQADAGTGGPASWQLLVAPGQLPDAAISLPALRVAVTPPPGLNWLDPVSGRLIAPDPGQTTDDGRLTHDGQRVFVATTSAGQTGFFHLATDAARPPGPIGWQPRRDPVTGQVALRPVGPQRPLAGPVEVVVDKGFAIQRPADQRYLVDRASGVAYIPDPAIAPSGVLPDGRPVELVAQADGAILTDAAGHPIGRATPRLPIGPGEHGQSVRLPDGQPGLAVIPVDGPAAPGQPLRLAGQAVVWTDGGFVVAPTTPGAWEWEPSLQAFVDARPPAPGAVLERGSIGPVWRSDAAASDQPTRWPAAVATGTPLAHETRRLGEPEDVPLIAYPGELTGLTPVDEAAWRPLPHVVLADAGVPLRAVTLDDLEPVDPAQADRPLRAGR